MSEKDLWNGDRPDFTQTDQINVSYAGCGVASAPTYDDYVKQLYFEEVESCYNRVYQKYYDLCGSSRPSGHCLNICKDTLDILPEVLFTEYRIVGGLVGSGVQHWWMEVSVQIIDAFYPEDLHEPKMEMLNNQIIQYRRL